MFTLESPVVSHVEVREAGGQDVGAVLVPQQVAAPRGKGLHSDINTEFREILSPWREQSSSGKWSQSWWMT